MPLLAHRAWAILLSIRSFSSATNSGFASATFSVSPAGALWLYSSTCRHDERSIGACSSEWLSLSGCKKRQNAQGDLEFPARVATYCHQRNRALACRPITNCWKQIKSFHDRIGRGTRGLNSRVGNHEWRAERFLEQGVLSPDRMLAQVPTMVAPQDHHRILGGRR